jgi:hypothetical protein
LLFSLGKNRFKNLSINVFSKIHILF